MMPAQSVFTLAFIFLDVTDVTDVTALMGAACGGYVWFPGDVTDVTKPAPQHTGRMLPAQSVFTLAFIFLDVTDVTKPAHRHSLTASLTALARSVHAENTTSINGNPAPRKLCGFFVPAVLVSGLLTRHTGRGTTPVFRIGG